jgi:hypothetical protein
MWAEDHDPQTLGTSLIGRARALEQIAGFVERLPAFRKRTRRQRNYIASELRLEATRARRDIRDAQRIGERKIPRIGPRREAHGPDCMFPGKSVSW